MIVLCRVFFFFSSSPLTVNVDFQWFQYYWIDFPFALLFLNSLVHWYPDSVSTEISKICHRQAVAPRLSCPNEFITSEEFPFFCIISVVYLRKCIFIPQPASLAVCPEKHFIHSISKIVNQFSSLHPKLFTYFSSYMFLIIYFTFLPGLSGYESYLIAIQHELIGI